MKILITYLQFNAFRLAVAFLSGLFLLIIILFVLHGIGVAFDIESLILRNSLTGEVFPRLIF